MKRRKFISDSITTVAGVILLPVIVPSESQSSLPHFRLVEEFIKNGGIGKLESVKIGLQMESITKSGQKYFDTAEVIVAGTQIAGPLKIEATVLQREYIAKAEFGNGITMLTGSNYSDGIRYEGTEGWIFVTNDEKNTDSSNKRLLQSLLQENYSNHTPHKNLMKSMLSVSAAEAGHRACSLGVLMDIAMKTGRQLSWDSEKERFIDDFEANSML